MSYWSPHRGPGAPPQRSGLGFGWGWRQPTRECTLLPVELHQRVRQAREAAGLSRSALERAAGLTSRTVERIELRGQRPARAVLEAIASALGTTAAELGGESRALLLPEVMDGLVRRHGGEQVAVEAIRAAFREKM